MHNYAEIKFLIVCLYLLQISKVNLHPKPLSSTKDLACKLTHVKYAEVKISVHVTNKALYEDKLYDSASGALAEQRPICWGRKNRIGARQSYGMLNALLLRC